MESFLISKVYNCLKIMIHLLYYFYSFYPITTADNAGK